MGVMPLPAANNTKELCIVRGVNRPEGGRTSKRCPALTWSSSQLDPNPPRTRLTVTARGSPGPLEME